MRPDEVSEHRGEVEDLFAFLAARNPQRARAAVDRLRRTAITDRECKLADELERELRARPLPPAA